MDAASVILLNRLNKQTGLLAAVYDTSQYTLTSSPHVLNASTLQLSFVGPPSGQVLIRETASVAATLGGIYWSQWEGVTPGLTAVDGGYIQVSVNYRVMQSFARVLATAVGVNYDMQYAPYFAGPNLSIDPAYVSNVCLEAWVVPAGA